jgi:hypothetical protein
VLDDIAVDGAAAGVVNLGGILTETPPFMSMAAKHS